MYINTVTNIFVLRKFNFSEVECWRVKI